ncbi:hypothetical protein ACWEN3_38225 [Streptomyces sp. NPDC004561]
MKKAQVGDPGLFAVLGDHSQRRAERPAGAATGLPSRAVRGRFTGKLYVYPGTGCTTSPYGSRNEIDTGWGTYNAIA